LRREGSIIVVHHFRSESMHDLERTSWPTIGTGKMPCGHSTAKGTPSRPRPRRGRLPSPEQGQLKDGHRPVVLLTGGPVTLRTPADPARTKGVATPLPGPETGAAKAACRRRQRGRARDVLIRRPWQRAMQGVATAYTSSHLMSRLEGFRAGRHGQSAMNVARAVEAAGVGGSYTSAAWGERRRDHSNYHKRTNVTSHSLAIMIRLLMWGEIRVRLNTILRER